MRSVGVSAATGQGMDAFLEKLSEAKDEYEKDYKQEYERLKVKKSQ